MRIEYQQVQFAAQVAVDVDQDGRGEYGYLAELAGTLNGMKELGVASDNVKGLLEKVSALTEDALDKVKKLEGAGVSGVTLFNRFFQPDIDIEELELRLAPLHSWSLYWMVRLLIPRIAAALVGDPPTASRVLRMV